MRKFLLLPALIVSFFLAAQGTALASGYSMVAIYEDAVLLANFSDTSFTQTEVNTYSQVIDSLVSQNLSGTTFLLPNQLSDKTPDQWRSWLQPFTSSYDIYYIEVSRGDSRVPAQGDNIWLDIWYDNDNMYVGSFGFPESMPQNFN